MSPCRNHDDRFPDASRKGPASPSALRVATGLLCFLAGTPALFGQAQIGSVSGAPTSAFGSSIAVVPDRNSDGLPEYLIGAPSSNGSATIRAGGSGALLGVLVPPGPTVGFGQTVANAGDLNGDGQEDFLVSASNSLNPLNASGAVYAFSGASLALLWDFDPTDIATVATNALGVRMVPMGDVNGDSFDDVAVTYSRSLLGWPPEVYVLSGKDAAILYVVQSTFFDVEIATTGDLDGDGVRELLASDQGTVFVHSGKTGALLRFHGVNLGGGILALGVAGLGDVDGDGVEDYAAARSSTDAATLPGGLIAFSGQSGGPLYTILRSSGFGMKIAAVPDVNQDGAGEIAVTISNYDGGPTVAEVQVLSGSTGDHLFSRFGSAAIRFGEALVGADLDADGVGDLGIGAPGADRVDLISGTCEPVVAIGAPTLGTGGISPSLSAMGCPWQGRADFALEIDLAVGGAIAFLLVGSQSASVALPSGALFVDVSSPFVLAAVPLSGGSGVAGAGAAAIPFAIPVNPALAASPFFAQVFVVDPAAQAGLAHTQGVRIQVTP